MKAVNEIARRRRVRNAEDPEQYSQEVVARKLGVTRATLGSWEAGRTEPTVRQALALARILGCTVEELGYQT
jgi:putative transcriptional regulator